MKYLLLLLVTFLTMYSTSQSNAEFYFSTIRQAEQQIVQNNLDSALYFYSKAFDEFDTPFVRELLQATIIASFKEDKEEFYKLLPKCIERGVHNGELSILFEKNFEDDSVYNNLIKNYDFYHDNYLQSIACEAYTYFDQIDILDQIKTKQSMSLGKPLDIELRGLDTMTKLYKEGVKKYGWPTEKRVGIGNLVGGAVLRNGNIQRLSERDQDNIVANYYDSIICKDTSCRYIVVSGKSIYTTTLYQNTRKGNSFLWHLMAFEDSVLNNFIINGAKDLKIHPLFIAQAIERSQTKENDCLLGMGSMYYMNELRYKRHKKYGIPNQSKEWINKNRKRYFLPTLQEEEKLLKALYYLRTGKYDEKLRKSAFKKYEYLFSIFTNTNVG